ncbi:MAG: sodium:proton antiporter NhaD, partial [Methylocella sp.]
AKAYRDKGDFDKALANYDEAVRLDPKPAPSYFDRGEIHQAKGNFDQAIADFGQATARDPKFAAAYNNRGLAFSAKGDLDKALADFDEAVRLDPKFAAAFLSRASAYRAKDDLEHARLDLLTALRLDPRLGPAKDALDEVNRRIAESAAAPPAAPPRAAPEGVKLPDLTGHWVGFAALAIFAVAYALVMTEEVSHLRKSKPVVVAAGILWIMIAFVYSGLGLSREVENSLRHVLLEYAELLLFLLVAMTYVNALEERCVFDVLRAWMVRSGFSYRKLFWLTGTLAFFMSPVADNLTTALVMCAVVMAVGIGAPRFVALSCINVVVAANAGGAFSPFGDITTLMVWQKGIVAFGDFFRLFLPSAVNFIVPAVLMHRAIPRGAPAIPAARDDMVSTKLGGRRIIALFVATIATAVSVHTFLHLPPVLGMMTGLGYLQLFGFYLQQNYRRGKERGDYAF